jgi:hypothetical protein
MPLNQPEEARHLARVFEGRPDALVTFLSSQLGVLKTQSQMLMGLSGLVVTVTGFSGHNMVRGGLPSTIAMFVGILGIMAAVLVTLRVSARLRWVSRDLDDDLEQTALTVIRRRDAQSTALGRARIFVSLGLGAYLLSVMLAAVSLGTQMSPPPS